VSSRYASGDDRGVLVTGCSSGIGRSIAQRLARGGWTVFATVRREKDRESLLSLGEKNLVPVCPFELTEVDRISRVMDFVGAELARRGLPGLYALVNNAGGGSVAPIELLDLSLFELELKARLVGTVGLVQKALPLLRKGGGRIVWIVTPAIIPTPYVADIHACDFAVNCVVRTLGIELAPWEIPCVQVRCGGIRTGKGLGTTKEVESLLRHPKADLYRERLEAWSRAMAEFDGRRTAPEKVAMLVEKALRSRFPRKRYSVGYMHRAAAFLESLPQCWVDRILSSRF
jgi:NAD(P)-dependent dehydrogenase (short-subunit alcohol dehydrogenase family)